MQAVAEPPPPNRIGARSLLTEEEVGQEVGDVLVELVLGREEYRLVLDEQEQHVEEEQTHDGGDQLEESCSLGSLSTTNHGWMMVSVSFPSGCAKPRCEVCQSRP